MNPIIIIPARLAASRLPGKPLALIGGRPMILHVLDRAREARVGPVAVAAGDPEIVDAVRAAGGTAVLTDPALPSGSDRVHAALGVLDPDRTHDVVINLQGDLPSLPPEYIKAVLEPLNDQTIDMGKLESPNWALPLRFPEPPATIRGFHQQRFCFLLQPHEGRLKLLAPLRGGV